MKVLLYNERGIEVLKNLNEINLSLLKRYEFPIFTYTDSITIENLFSVYTLASNLGADVQFAVKMDQAADFVKKLESFNDFDSKLISEKILQLAKIRKFYNKNNPNNGQSLIEKVWFNRDYSKITFDFGLINKEDLEDFEEIVELFRLPKSDEFILDIPYESDSSVAIKISNWWD